MFYKAMVFAPGILEIAGLLGKGAWNTYKVTKNLDLMEAVMKSNILDESIKGMVKYSDEAMEHLFKQLAEEGTEKATKEAGEKVAKEAAEEVVENGVKKILQQSTDNVVKKEMMQQDTQQGDWMKSLMELEHILESLKK